MLCKEYSLSVIEPTHNKGKQYGEYVADKNGGSWKTKLRQTIDSVIKRALDFDDFILRMELAGYTVKRQNKNISFCNGEREKFMRSKTLGDNYTVEAIKARIKKQRSRPQQERKGISLLIDIQNSIKAQHSKGYFRVPAKSEILWVEEEQHSGARIRRITDLSEAEFATTRAKVNNLKQASKTLNFITEHNISNYDELEKAVSDIHKKFDNTREELKSVEKHLNDMNVMLKYLSTYTKLKPMYAQYKRARNKAAFKNKHQSEIILYEAAVRALKGTNPPTLQELKNTCADLSERKEKLYAEYGKLKKRSAEIDVIKSNIDTILGKEYKQEIKRETEL